MKNHLFVIFGDYQVENHWLRATGILDRGATGILG